jgi:hypothetical protein
MFLLAPTWTKFTEAQKELTADKKFNFGEVDCQANGGKIIILRNLRLCLLILLLFCRPL